MNPSAKPSRRRRSLVFLVRFLGLLLAFSLALASHPGNDRVVIPLTSVLARASGTLLHLMGEPVTVAGTDIRSPTFSVNIENGCNGVETALLLGSAILAYPATWKRRLAGLAIGFVAIELVNLVRIASLYWIGAHHPSLFSQSHTVIWQSIVVLWGVLLFLVWAAAPTRLAEVTRR
jgi:exosortase H (IPTLxxWG-CTERM-specific)